MAVNILQTWHTRECSSFKLNFIVTGVNVYCVGSEQSRVNVTVNIMVLLDPTCNQAGEQVSGGIREQ